MVKRYTALPFALTVCSHLFAQNYCSPTFFNGCSVWHSMAISIGTVDWASDGDCNSYDHTATSVILQAGVAVPMTVTSGTWCGVAVWMDLNNNLAFEESERLHSEYVGGDPSYTYNFPITIPLGTAPGSYRMRIISPWGSDGLASPNGSGPCGAYEYGNFDDFTAQILGPDGIEERNANPLVVGPNPTTGQLSVRTDEPLQRIIVSGIDGRVVLDERMANTTNVTLDLSAQPAGLYNVRCANGNTSQVVRVVKE